MSTRTFFNIEVESDAEEEAMLQMIDWLKKQPGLVVKETITWVTVVTNAPPVIQPAGPKWRVTVQTWNIRSLPSMLDNVEIIGQLKQGEIVAQLEENTTWIRHDGGGILGRAGWSGKRGMTKI